MSSIRIAFLAVLVLVLGACGGVPTRINPPVAKIQQLAVEPSGAWRVTVRLHNFSNVTMRFASVKSIVTVGGSDAGTLALDPAMDIPPEAADIVHVTFTPSAAARDALARGATDSAGVPYRLEGSIRTEDPDKTFEFTHESTLTPVPGRPGEFR